VSLPIGIYSAMRRHSVGDYGFTFIGFIGLAVPNFILALTPDVSQLSLFRAERGRAVQSAICRRALELGQIRRSARSICGFPIIVIGTRERPR
jgi:ABC-type antimicrobial peptide transport system permease subunit